MRFINTVGCNSFHDSWLPEIYKYSLEQLYRIVLSVRALEINLSKSLYIIDLLRKGGRYITMRALKLKVII